MDLLPPRVEADLAAPLHDYWLKREAQHVKDVYAGVRLQKMPEDLRVYEHLLWISRADTVQPTHIAFTARSREAVDAFFDAAIRAGGKDNGKPGVRAEYHPSYYGAFVLDPDGHNVEAVIHTPA